MDCKIITIFNEKGGAGKTTTAMNLAGTLGKRGFKALVVDMDDQATSTKWAAQAPDGALFPADVINLNPMGDKVHRELKKYIETYDFIVIDCPPGKVSKIPDSAMKISDLAIIPLSLSPADLWASQNARNIALDARDFNEDLQIRYLANKVKANRNLGRDVLSVIEQDEEIPLMTARIGDRVAFETSIINGETVHGMGQEKAIFEVEHMTDEVLVILGVKHGKSRR